MGMINDGMVAWVRVEYSMLSGVLLLFLVSVDFEYDASLYISIDHESSRRLR
jgi:hypothetical protein